MSQQQIIETSIAQARREYQSSRYAEAASLCDLVLQLEPDRAEALHILGMCEFSVGRLESALALVQQASSLDESSSETFASLGLIHLEMGQPKDAVAALEKSISLNADSAGAWYNLGIACRRLGDTQRAIDVYRRAVALEPHFPQAFNNTGHGLRMLGRYEEAVIAYSKGLAIQPDHIEARNNLGVTFKDLGRLDEAIECFRQALDYDPNCVAVHDNLLFASLYDPQATSESLAAAHREWNDCHALPLAREIPEHDNDPSPQRRLRVGYVSPDFRTHCQSLFTLPLLSNHDHEQFEVICYSSAPAPDQVTVQIQRHADIWRDVSKLPDEQLTDLIRRDRIDVLVDLTMHMSRNRLLAFARKPAPVQVTWLAYPGTTGLTSIDYRLTDPHLDPSGMDESIYSERTWRLPETFWCYDPSHEEIDPGPLPMQKNGYVTFGCLNNFCKINPGMLFAWSRIMQAIPNSRLMILAPEGHARKDLIAQLPIDPNRIIFSGFQPRSEYLKLYQQIDVSLDTFPYNGHTTSLDSLWMGVPVVTRCGTSIVSRAGYSQAVNLGLMDIVASSEEEFVHLAVGLANAAHRLSELRKTLRDRMKRSPLMDAPRFAKGVEKALREMWCEWCDAKSHAGRHPAMHVIQ